MKRFLVLVASVLIFSAVPAMAQIQFAVAGGNQQVRGEGHTETVNSVTLTFSSTATASIPINTTINFSYSGTVTNSAAAATPPSNITCRLNGTAFAIGTCPNMTESVTGNVVTLSFTAAQTLTTGDFITLGTIRVDVAGLGTGVTSVNCSLSSAPASSNITYNPTAVPVALVIFPSIAVKYSAAGTAITTCSPPTFAGAGPGLIGSGPFPGGASSFVVTVKETFVHAFSTLTEEQANTPTSAALPAVTHGTQIIIAITGINAGLNVRFNGVSTAAISGFNVLPAASWTDLSSSGDDQTSTGTTFTATFVFEVIADVRPGLDAGAFVFTIYKASGNTVALGTSTVTGTTQLGPNGSVGSPPSSTASLLFGVFPTTGNVDSITDCVTNLLFPWVVFIPTANFDTGIAIANTTKDPFGIGSAVPSTGAQTCTLNGFPTTTSTLSSGPTPLTAISFTTPAVPAGATFAQAVSGISPFNATSFTGYVIAVCLFQNAHGFAFISQNLGASAGVVEGYLALIIPTPAAVNRTPAGGGLGEALNN